MALRIQMSSSEKKNQKEEKKTLLKAKLPFYHQAVHHHE